MAMTQHDDLEALVSIDTFASAHGVATRTVRRWLEAERIPGARMIGKRWALPLDAVVQDAAPGSAVATAPPAAAAAAAPLGSGRVGQALTVAAVLAPLPVMVPLDTAARVLGVTEYALRRNAEYFQLVRMGDRGAYVMPKARIRQLDGDVS